MSAAITAAVISAGAGMYGAHQANKASKNAMKQGQGLRDFQNKTLLPYSKQMLDDSAGYYGKVGSFWDKLATGGTEGYMGVLGPQMQQWSQQAQQSRDAAAQFGARGTQAQLGGQAVGGLQQQQAQAIQAMKPMAMGQLQDLAGQQGALGTSVANSAQSGQLGLNQQQWGIQKDSMAQGEQYGQALAGLLGMLGQQGQTWWQNRQQPATGSIGTLSPQQGTSMMNAYLPYTNAGGMSFF